MSFIDSIKGNSLLKILGILAIIYVGTSLAGTIFGVNLLSFNAPSTVSRDFASNEYGAPSSLSTLGEIESGSSLTKDYAPQNNSTNRMVIQESTLSLQVEDVKKTRDKIVDHATKMGGYMVNSRTSHPDESATATITVRIPTERLDETLSLYRSLSIKVVSENLVGRDVTDQYVDIDERIRRLQRSQSKMEELLEKAEKLQDIINLTREVLGLQNQIDSLVGQQKSIEQNAELTKITLYLSTDDLALPYTPDDAFRPSVIFKLSVRSLVRSLRSVASFTIWVGVYSVIWIPTIVIYKVVRKKRGKLNEK